MSLTLRLSGSYLVSFFPMVMNHPIVKRSGATIIFPTPNDCKYLLTSLCFGKFWDMILVPQNTPPDLDSLKVT